MMMMKKKIDWDNPEKGLLNSINAFYQTINAVLSRFFTLLILLADFVDIIAAIPVNKIHFIANLIILAKLLDACSL